MYKKLQNVEDCINLAKSISVSREGKGFSYVHQKAFSTHYNSAGYFGKLNLKNAWRNNKKQIERINAELPKGISISVNRDNIDSDYYGEAFTSIIMMVSDEISYKFYCEIRELTKDNVYRFINHRYDFIQNIIPYVNGVWGSCQSNNVGCRSYLILQKSGIWFGDEQCSTKRFGYNEMGMADMQLTHMYALALCLKDEYEKSNPVYKRTHIFTFLQKGMSLWITFDKIENPTLEQ